MRTFLHLATATLVVLAACATADAKKKPRDYRPFKGSYTGTVAVTAGATAFSGPASIAIRVPRKGRSATVAVNATITVGGSLRVLTNTFVLRGTFTEADVTYEVEGPSGPSSGKCKVKPTSIDLSSAPFGKPGSPGTTLSTFRIKPVGKRKLTLFLHSFVQIVGQSNALIYDFTVTRRVKPPK